MNPFLITSGLYAMGAAITCTWLARALKRNTELRRRHEDLAGLVGWPLVAVATVLGWPYIVLTVAIWGEPHLED